MSQISFPHTFTHGQFAGRTFKTREAYDKARAAVKAPGTVWPRAISRGPFRGRTFNSQAEYMQAYHEWKANHKLPAANGNSFRLVMTVGETRMEVSGPLNEHGVDSLLDALGRAMSGPAE